MYKIIFFSYYNYLFLYFNRILFCLGFQYLPTAGVITGATTPGPGLGRTTTKRGFHFSQGFQSLNHRNCSRMQFVVISWTIFSLKFLPPIIYCIILVFQNPRIFIYFFCIKQLLCITHIIGLLGKNSQVLVALSIGRTPITTNNYVSYLI